MIRNALFVVFAGALIGIAAYLSVNPLVYNVQTKVARGLVAVALVNFIVLGVMDAIFGGNGLEGHASDGHYFVCHQTCREVSRRVFEITKWQLISLFVTHPLGFLSGLYLFSLKRGK